MKTALPGVKIVEDETTPEVLAKAIVDVANGARKLLGSRLSRRAVLVLIKDSIPGNGVGINGIGAVLDAASKLDKSCLKPLAGKK